jgi:hypothetical protein
MHRMKNRIHHSLRTFSMLFLCMVLSASCLLSGCGHNTAANSSSTPLASAVTEEKKADLVFDVVQTNSWQESEKYACQYSASLENNTNHGMASWTVVLDAGETVTIKDFWNCKLTANGTELTFTPADYNQKIEARNKVSDVGFIVLGDQHLSLEGRYSVDQESGKTQKLLDQDLFAASAASETSSTPALDRSNDIQGSPLAVHGALSVKGADLMDAHGNPFQLKGVSTHGLAWFPQFVSEDSFKTLRDDWGANLVRLALYTDENGGWCTDGDQHVLDNTIDTGVQAATNLGMYVIIDWHVLHDLTPVKYQAEAEAFFDKMSLKYADHDNVIYEICNEPNGGTSWQEVKSYAEDIIPIIRKNAPDALILVGTPNWSQDINAAAQDPIQDGGNLMYTMHFYAATHKDDLRQQMASAHDSGMPVFISEFSIVDASGSGAIDYDSAEKWKTAINDRNISYAAWSLCNKDESSALLKPSAPAQGWTDDDLSDTGIWIRDMIRGQ